MANDWAGFNRRARELLGQTPEPFSSEQPRAQMKIVTTCERVQPYAAGVDKKGELVWEGRQMPRWQMELFRLARDWYSTSFRRWMEVFQFETSAREFKEEDGFLNEHVAKSKHAINKSRWDHVERARQMWQKGD